MTELADQVREIRCRRVWWGPETTSNDEDRVLRWWHDDPEIDDLELRPADRSRPSQAEWEWVMLEMAAAPPAGTRPEDLVEIARRALIPTGTPVVARSGRFDNDRHNAWITPSALAELADVDRPQAARALAQAAKAGVMVTNAKTLGAGRRRWPGWTSREKNSYTFADAAAALDAWHEIPSDQLAAAGLAKATAAFDTEKARHAGYPQLWGIAREERHSDRDLRAALAAGLVTEHGNVIVPADRVPEVHALITAKRDAQAAAQQAAKDTQARTKDWAEANQVPWGRDTPTVKVPTAVLNALLAATESTRP